MSLLDEYNLLDQVTRKSNKIFFLYNISGRRLDYLLGPVEIIWQQDVESLKTDPASFLTSIHPDDVDIIRKHYKGVLEGNRRKLQFRQITNTNSDENIRYLTVEAYKITDAVEQQDMLVGTVEDTTKHEKYVNHLIEFGRRKNNVLEVISHDLRGPLHIVQSVLDLLRHDHSKHKYEEISSYIDIIGRACASCLSLIDEVLSDESNDAPATSANKEPVEVVSKVQEIMDALKSSGTIPHHFHFEEHPERLVAEVDETKFTQILNNLLSNAIKFTPPGGHITVSLSINGPNLLMTVADTGIGIPESLKKHIFEKYSKAARPGLRGENTRGIGTAIVRDLVELQGGEIWFESEENKGTTFYISLPLQD